MKRAAFWFLCAIVLAFGAAGACVAFAQPVNPAVTQANIGTTICVHGWTATVRPTTNATNKRKAALMVAAGIPWARAGEIELDHHMPIELGGAPADPANLWLQSWAPVSPWPGIEAGARLKDVVETRLHRMVCAGQLPLAVAQQCIFNDWRACALQYPPAKAGKTTGGK